MSLPMYICIANACMCVVYNDMHAHISIVCTYICMYVLYQCSAEAAFLCHYRTKTVPVGHLAHIDFWRVAGL